MEKEIFNKKDTREKRKKLRQNQTKAEKLFWSKVRAKKFLGLKFRRQHGIGEYIVDFYSSELKLVVEIDGEDHFTDEGKEYDKIRTSVMSNLGIRVIRFTNDEVINSIEMVLRRLKEEVNKTI